jgi:rubrerythrin
MIGSGLAYNPCHGCKANDKCNICELTYRRQKAVVEVRHSRIKWVNRPIAAQYTTVTDEYGEKHYGKMHDRIENNLVGYCEECGKRLDDSFMNFCPNCGAYMRGAKMDGERREE